MKRAKSPEGTVLDWKDDSGEYASQLKSGSGGRIQQSSWPCSPLRLIVLTQLSSCNIERVFSQL